jgi:hypothetical protein
MTVFEPGSEPKYKAGVHSTAMLTENLFLYPSDSLLTACVV